MDGQRDRGAEGSATLALWAETTAQQKRTAFAHEPFGLRRGKREQAREQARGSKRESKRESKLETQLLVHAHSHARKQRQRGDKGRSSTISELKCMTTRTREIAGGRKKIRTQYQNAALHTGQSNKEKNNIGK
jgi:hypothetical protein